MSKHVDRILDEVEYNFERHYTDNEERVEFLEELIEEINDVLEELKDKLEDLNYDDDECGVCPEGECDCEPEVCI
jgi:vacuolar-type H+-ATPase subunit I/STV1